MVVVSTNANFGKSTYFQNMNRLAFTEINKGSQVGISILVIIGSFLVTVILSILITIPLFGLNFAQLQSLDNLTNPAYINAFKFMQIMQSTGLFILPPIIIGKIFSSNTFGYLKINLLPSYKLILLAFGIAAFAIPAINLIAMLNSQIRLPNFMSGIEASLKSSEKNAETITTAFMNVTTLPGLFLNLFMMALIPAIGEEFFFRGFLQKMISGWLNKHAAIILTGFIFSAIHMQFYGFFPRWLLGMLLGYMFVWSGNLWLPIAAHFANNAIAVIGYYLVNIHAINEKSVDFGSTFDSTTIIITLLSFFMMTGAIYLFYTNKAKKTIQD